MSLSDTMERFSKALPDLKLLGDTYKPSGSLTDESFWYHLKILGLEISGLEDMTKFMEQQYGTSTWENIDDWIADVQKQLNLRLRISSVVIDVSALNPTESLKSLREGGLFRQGSRDFGP